MTGSVGAGKGGADDVDDAGVLKGVILVCIKDGWGFCFPARRPFRREEIDGEARDDARDDRSHVYDDGDLADELATHFILRFLMDDCNI